jgi:hypothetical protein
MSMRWFIALTVLAITSSATLAADPPPNVVFILADDLGWTDLGCFHPPAWIQ